MGYIRKKINFQMMWRVIIFVGLILLTFFLIFKDQDFGELFKTIFSVDQKFIIIGILLMIVYFLIESYNIGRILEKLGNKVSLIACFRYTLIGFFFSAITPASTGGQPIELYYMTKDKISAGDGALTLLVQLCGFQISTIVLGIVSAIIKPELLSDGLVWFFILGIALNGIALATMLAFVFSKKMNERIINFIIRILTLLKVKNLEIRKKAIYDASEKYKNGAKFIKEHKLTLVFALLRSFVQILVYYSVPFCIYKAFGLNELTLIQFLPLQAILYTIVSGIPLPGSVGASETAFLKIFGPIFGAKLVKGGMLLSRGVTFYLFVLISLIVFIITAHKKKDIKGEIDLKALEYEEEMKQLEEDVRKNNKSNISI